MIMLGLRIRPWLLALLVLLAPALSLAQLSLAGTLGPLYLSEKELVRAYQQRETAGRALHYLDYLPASAAFYTGGAAEAISLAGSGLQAQGYWLAVHRTKGNRAPGHCSLVYQPGTGLFDLYLCHE